MECILVQGKITLPCQGASLTVGPTDTAPVKIYSILGYSNVGEKCKAYRPILGIVYQRNWYLKELIKEEALTEKHLQVSKRLMSLF